MTQGTPRADPDRLLAFLGAQFGDAVRSCVEYTPQKSRIHYLRDDLEADRQQAETRLVRIRELYQAERLSATPLVDDSQLGHLCVSYHLFEGALVVHLVDSSGRVIGVSLEPTALPDLFDLSVDSLDALYGEVPDGLDRS